MKKILFILSIGKLSGGEKVALDIANGLKNDFDFIFYLPEEPQKEFLEFLNGFKVYFAKDNSIFKISKNLKETIIKENPNIIVCHGTRSSIYLKIILFSLKKKFKFIYVLHGIHFIRRKFPFNYIFLFWEIFTNRIFVDKLVCIGKDDLDLSKRLKLINEKKVVMIENGINVEEYQNIPEGFLRKKFNLQNKKIFLTICRLHYPKDVKTLIKSINLLKDEDLVLFIVGDGPDRKELEELVNNLNLQEKIKFLGFQKEVKGIIKDAGIFILSTRWEGLPIIILEAWASKVPVVASNVHGIKGLIENEKDGLFFEFGNEKDLAEKIKILLKDEKLKEKLINNGYLKVKAEYNLNKMVEGYKTLFNLL
jgi:glycosyltransferase involved in cell wall biosynthesis